MAEIPIQQFGKIVFGLRSADEIRASAVQLLDGTDKNAHVSNKFGPADMRACGTCKQSGMKCVCHYGAIPLTEPIPKFPHVGAISNLIQLICPHQSENGEYHLIVKPAITNDVDRTLKHAVSRVGGGLLTSGGKRKSADAQTVCVECGEIVQEFVYPGELKDKKKDKWFGMCFNIRRPSDAEGKLIRNSEVFRRISGLSERCIRLLGINSTLAHPRDYFFNGYFPVMPTLLRMPGFEYDKSGANIGQVNQMISSLMTELRSLAAPQGPVAAPAPAKSAAKNAPRRGKRDANAGAASAAPDDVYRRQMFSVGSIANMLTYTVSRGANEHMLQMLKIKNKSAVPLPVTARLFHKTGFWRQGVFGYRISRVCRTVLTGSEECGPHEVMFPFVFANTMTICERVTTANLALMRMLVRKGANAYPGALYVIPAGNSKIRYSLEQDTEGAARNLVAGDFVERKIMDGDICIVNRMPSLHEENMQAMIIRVHTGKTAKIPLSICNVYNADFDGDEGQLIVLQSTAARASALMTMSVASHLLGSRNGEVMLYCTQDALTGSTLWNFAPQHMSRELASHLLSFTHNGEKLRAIMPGEDGKFDAHDVQGCIIPDGINFSTKGGIFNESMRKSREFSDVEIVVEDGRLKSGFIDKTLVGKDSVFLRRVAQEKDCMAGLHLIKNASALANAINATTGFSFSLSDMTPSAAAAAEMVKERDKTIAAMGQLYIDTVTGKEVYPHGQDKQSAYEEKQRVLMETYVGPCLRILGKDKDASSAFHQYTACGIEDPGPSAVRGITCVGQMLKDSERMAARLPGDRANIMSYSFDPRPVAHGFCTRSYIQGCSMAEVASAAMTTRESMIKSRSAVAQPGYLNRRLSINLQDVVLTCEGLIVNSSHHVVSSCYGPGGFDPRYVHRYEHRPTLMQKTQFEKRQPAADADPILHEEYAQLCRDREEMQAYFVRTAQAGIRTGDTVPKLFLAINVDIGALVVNARRATAEYTDVVEATYVASEVRKYVEKLPEAFSSAKNPSPRLLAMTEIAGRVLRDAFTSHVVVDDLKLSAEAFDYCMQRFFEQYCCNVAQPGDAVGIKAALNIMELLTQETLDSQKLKGQSTTRGVFVTLTDLTSISENSGKMQSKRSKARGPVRTTVGGNNSAKKTKGYRTIVAFKDKLDKAAAHKIGKFIECIYMKDLIADDQVIFGPAPSAPWSEHPTAEPDSVFQVHLRIYLNPVMMEGLEMTIADVVASINAHHKGQEFVRYVLPDSACGTVWLFFEQCREDKNARARLDEILVFRDSLLGNYLVRGIHGLRDATVISNNTFPEIVDGELALSSRPRLSVIGSNLAELFVCRGLDPYNTFSNDIREIQHYLGIEAARSAIFNELVASFAESSKMKAVSPVHLSIIADYVTRRGIVTSINRESAANDTSMDVTQRMSYEKGQDVMNSAARNATVQTTASIPTQVMLGQRTMAGTGYIDVRPNIAAVLAFNREHSAKNTLDSLLGG